VGCGESYGNEWVMSIRWIVAASIVLLLPAAAAAQEFGDREAPGRVSIGGGVLIGQPVGEFGRYVPTGFGAGGQALVRLDPLGIVSLRLDLGGVNYGRESRRVCFSGTVGCRVLLDLTTNNNIAFLGFGPHLEAPFRFAQPFVHAGIGGSYFATTSALRGTNQSENFASTTNFDDITFAWLAGGGLNIPLSRGRTPIKLQLAAKYHGNGSVEYVREGDIEDHPDGSITIRPTRSQANLVTYQIGISALLRRR
jgi:hypothetical protein